MISKCFRSLLLAFAGIASIVCVSCSRTEANSDEQKKIDEYMKANNLTGSPTASGLFYIETTAGSGVQAKAGNTVDVHYTGTLLDGTKFDSSKGGDPFSFVLGASQVIAGWDEGIALMKKGSKGKLIIPSKLAYGSSAISKIPANSVLVFDVELVNVK